jgi:hypothetical protein
MEVVITWVIIGLIAGVLYTAPQYILNYMKEGFNAVMGNQTTNQMISGTLSPEQIDTMRKMLGSPNFEENKGFRAQPEGITGSSESKSSGANTQNAACLSSAQGVAYRNLSNPGAPSSNNLQTQETKLPAPIPDNSPKCPDLKDYIRKDRIPCWGCKL